MLLLFSLSHAKQEMTLGNSLLVKEIFLEKTFFIETFLVETFLEKTFLKHHSVMLSDASDLSDKKWEFSPCFLILNDESRMTRAT